MVAGAVLAGLTTGGCSFLFSEGAPGDRTSRPFLSCGESYAPPVLATIAAGVFGLSLVGAKKDSRETEAEYEGGLAAIGTATALALTGAIYGYGAVSSCRNAKQARAIETWRAAWLPPPYGLPPWGTPPRVWPPPLTPSGAAPARPPASVAPAAPATNAPSSVRPAAPASDQPAQEEPSVIVDPPRTEPRPTP